MKPYSHPLVNKFLLVCLAVIFVMAFLLPGSSYAQTASESTGLFIDAGVESGPVSQDEAVIRARLVAIDFKQLGGENGPQLDGPDSGQGTKVILNLFEDAVYMATLQTLTQNASGSYTWMGTLDGYTESHVFLVVRDNILIGKIATDQNIYGIEYTSGGLHRIVQFNQAAFIDEEGPSPIPEIPSPLESTPEAIEASDDGSVMDVMVVYTPAARTGAGGTTAMESLIELGIAEANTAYFQSGIAQRIYLVHTEEVVYTESGSFNTDLTRLTNTSDGFMDNVHTLRNTYHADFVPLIIETPTSSCGVGWLQAAPALSFETSAFNVALRTCITPNYSMTHELGHNMGLRHDWYVDAGVTPQTYAHGYVNAPDLWRDIMAYNDHCVALFVSCTRLLYFSNPSTLYGGDPMGVPGGTSSSCVAGSLTPNPSSCDADNQAVLDSTASVNAQFRSSLNTWLGNSTDWNDANNWQMSDGSPFSPIPVNRVPRSIDNVLIPTTPTGGNFPVINGTFDVRDVVIQTGATLTMAGGTLTVYGEWEEQGTGQFNGNAGTVIFQSSLEQTIVTNSASSFNDVEIGNGGSTNSLTLLSTMDINGDLTIRSGATLSPGSFTISLAGDYTQEGLTGFSPGTGTVVFNGTGQTAQKTVTSQTAMNEPFEEGDGQPCCSSAYLPAGWGRVDNGSGSGFLGGQPGGTTSGTARAYNNGTTTQSWLFSLALSLEPNVQYQLPFDYRNLTTGYNHTLSIYLGTQQNSTSMLAGTLLTQVSNIISNVYTTGNTTFTVSSSGTYYIGFLATKNTAGDQYFLLDNLSLTGTQEMTFYDLTVNTTTNPATLNTNTTVQNNLLVNGILDVALNTLTVNGSVTNNGTMRQSKTVGTNSSTTFEFLHLKTSASATRYRGVDLLSDGTNVGVVEVEIKGNQSSCNVGDELIHRCYKITLGNSVTTLTGVGAKVTFYFESAEVAGNGGLNACNTLNIYHWNSGMLDWDAALTLDTTHDPLPFGNQDGRKCTGEGNGTNPTGSTTDPFSVKGIGIINFSPFGLKSLAAPTAIQLSYLSAQPSSLEIGYVVAFGIFGLGVLFFVRRKLKKAQPSLW